MCCEISLFQNMDSSSWATVVSIVMALSSLAVFGVDKEQNSNTDRILKPLFEVLFFVSVLAMLLFIFGIKEGGAILMTIALISIFSIVLLGLLSKPFVKVLSCNIYDYCIKKIYRKKVTYDSVGDIHEGISDSTYFE